MNKKTRATAFAIVLFLLVAIEIVYIFSELYTENDINQNTEVTDAMKFKEEYESLNGTQNSSGVDVRNLTIDEDNPFIYATAEEIATKMESGETFIVYFGFKSCPWCRSILTSLIESAKENNVNKVYYVDVYSIRDKYELDENNKAVKTTEGTEGYYKLLELMDNVLDDYSPLTYTNSKGKEKTVEVDEKRIYAPNIVAVKEGKAVSLETGIIDSLTDAYMEIDDGMKCEMKELFKCLFESITTESETCEIGANIC